VDLQGIIIASFPEKWKRQKSRFITESVRLFFARNITLSDDLLFKRSARCVAKATLGLQSGLQGRKLDGDIPIPDWLYSVPSPAAVEVGGRVGRGTKRK
jgi:hypothetical protein